MKLIFEVLREIRQQLLNILPGNENISEASVLDSNHRFEKLSLDLLFSSLCTLYKHDLTA